MISKVASQDDALRNYIAGHPVGVAFCISILLDEARCVKRSYYWIEEIPGPSILECAGLECSHQILSIKEDFLDARPEGVTSFIRTE